MYVRRIGTIINGGNEMKKSHTIALALLVAFVFSGMVLWKHFTSPTYSLMQIKNAIEDHDVTSFEKYVDLSSITSRVITELPDALGSQKVIDSFGQEGAGILIGFVKESFVKSTRELVNTFIERGHIDKSLIEQGSLSKFMKKLPMDNLSIVEFQETKIEGKICRVPIELHIGSFDGNAVLELMMRDKGSYWQLAELSNLPDFISDAVEIQRTYPYRNIFGATLYLANLVNDLVVKSEILKDVAVELARAGEIEKARSVFLNTVTVASSSKINPRDRSYLLGDIAYELARAGENEMARDVFSDAIKTANSIEASWVKNPALNAIVSRLTKVGEIERALSVSNSGWAQFSIVNELAKDGNFEKALLTVRSIDNVEARASALRVIAREATKSGMRDISVNVLPKALEAAKSIEEIRAKTRRLREIAGEFAKLGEIDKAEGIFSIALEAANSIEETPNRSRVNRDIAGELAKAGLFERALSIAESIEDDQSRTSALGKIANELAQAERVVEADAIFINAIESASIITDVQTRAFELGNIAHYLTENGEFEQSSRVLSDALEASYSIERAGPRAYAQLDIMIELAKVGEIEKTLDVAKSIEKMQTRAYLLSLVVRDLATAGEVEKALTLANVIDHSSERATALCYAAIKSIETNSGNEQDNSRIANIVMTIFAEK
jgi:tetratricopeptide (TPR) repeat protein